MTNIYKQIIQHGTTVLPNCQAILHVSAQTISGNEVGVIWYEHRPGAPTVRLVLAVTGSVPPSPNYIGTFLLDKGTFVGHVYKL